MKSLALSALSALASLVALSASPARLSGVAPDYAGRTLVFRCEADPVSRMPHDIEAVEVAPDGSFSFSADVAEVTRVTVDLSFYVAHIYLEPGARYVVSLPPFRMRPDAERFNPFYEPRRVPLTILSSSSDLNKALSDFDRAFAQIYYPAAARLVRHHDKALADKLVLRLDSAARAAGCDKPFFRQQVFYRKAQVFATPRMASPRAVISRFFAGRPLLLNVPAYWQTIDMLAPDVIHQSAIPAVRNKLKEAMAAREPNVAALSAALAADTLFASGVNLREALIVKNLADDFYSGDMTDGRTDSMLISAARHCASKKVRLMAANVYAKKNKLKPGLPAPDFHLVDNADNEISLSTFKGRFLYLCFMHTENYECVKAMPVLDNLAQLHRADLDVLCVFTDDKADDAYSYLARKGYFWKAVSFVADQKILDEYEVKALPTYFLIAPDGCVAMAQAPGPAENVGPAIASAIRQYIIASKRGRPEVPRTIYDIANEAR